MRGEQNGFEFNLVMAAAAFALAGVGAVVSGRLASAPVRHRVYREETPSA